MLQYSVQLPPLSITSSKPRNRSRAASSAQAAVAHGSAPSPSSKRTDVRSPAYAHSPVPLPLTTTYTSSPSISSGSPSLPPTPSLPTAYPFPQTASPLGTPLMTSKPIPRSPYISHSTLPVNVPGTRSPFPTKSIPLPSSGLPSPTLPNLDSHFRSTSSNPSSFSSSVLDVLSPGDVIGEGLELQGEVVRCVPITPLHSSDRTLSHPEPATASCPSSTIAGPFSEEPARTFEVVKKLGTGSYAVVYLVREVLYRAPEVEENDYEDDGADLDMSMDGHDDAESVKGGRSNEYGREYAVKLLSKANLDSEALEAQVLEVRHHVNSLCLIALTMPCNQTNRLKYTNLYRSTPTSCRSIACSTPRRSFFSCSSSYQARTCSTSSNRHGTTTSPRPRPSSKRSRPQPPSQTARSRPSRRPARRRRRVS